MMRVCRVDDTLEAIGSEDFLPNRWAFQVEAIKCISRSFAHPRGAAPGSAVSGNARNDDDSVPLLCVVGSAAKARTLFPPSSDAAAALNHLRDHHPMHGRSQFAQALRLALLVRICLCPLCPSPQRARPGRSPSCHLPTDSSHLHGGGWCSRWTPHATGAACNRCVLCNPKRTYCISIAFAFLHAACDQEGGQREPNPGICGE